MATTIDIPQMYNAANHFIDRHSDRTPGNRIAYTDYAGDWTYQELVAMVNQAGNVLSNLGLKEKQRVLMCMTDSVFFPADSILRRNEPKMKLFDENIVRRK